MGRDWNYEDSDEYRMGSGMRCTGYDADEQVWFWRSGNGSVSRSIPGSKYTIARKSGSQPPLESTPAQRVEPLLSFMPKIPETREPPPEEKPAATQPRRRFTLGSLSRRRSASSPKPRQSRKSLDAVSETVERVTPQSVPRQSPLDQMLNVESSWKKVSTWMDKQENFYKQMEHNSVSRRASHVGVS